MRNLIIILACLATGVAHANSSDSTNCEVESLSPITISKPTVPLSFAHITLSDCMAPSHYYYRRYYYRRNAFGTGTRNINYYINYSLGSSSFAYDEPHINGSISDGNALFIDGIRVNYNPLIPLAP